MNLLDGAEWKERPLLFLVGLGLLILPSTNAIGQVPLYMASIFWVVQALRGKAFVRPSTWVGFAGFMLLIGISFFFAVRPAMGLSKLNRFLIFPLAGAVTAACVREKNPEAAVRFLCRCLVFGVVILGFYDFIRFPLRIREGIPFDHVGNMTSPQFYMVALVLWLGVIGWRTGFFRWALWAALPVLVTGLLIHQKRGVWLACAATIGLWTLWGRKWKILLVWVAALLGSLALPFVQSRLHHLENVVKPTHGGRAVLWTEVAPRLRERYPWGLGYNGSTYEEFREVLPAKWHLEEGLRHLHNNILQIRLELGWQGAGFWVLWMGWILCRALRPRAGMDPSLMLAIAFAFVGLHVNGMVEYNFGDSEIMKVYLVLIGLIDVISLPGVSRNQEENQEEPDRER